MPNTAPPSPPTALRRLGNPAAVKLTELAETFEDLQTVLRCCERLMTELERDPVDELVVEAVWTLALLAYGRSFAPRSSDAVLDESDLTSTHPDSNVLDWHHVLLRLRDHHAHVSANPRETFSVGVAQAPDGSPTAVGISSVHGAQVDALTVRQTGAISYALAGLVDRRIAEQQEAVFAAVQDVPVAELNKLTELEVSAP
jgi:hypothetical protein